MSKDLQTAIFKSCLVILSTCTAIINLLTFAMFIKFRKKLLRLNTHNRILCSMSLADALVGCFGATLGILLSADSPKIYYKLAGNIPLFSCMFASVSSLAILTADRLVALKRPHAYGTSEYNRLNIKMIAATWVVPLLVNILQTIIYVEASADKELMVRGIVFSVFFSVGVVTLIVSNLVLYLGVRKYVKEKEAMLSLRSLRDTSATKKSARKTSATKRNQISEIGQEDKIGHLAGSDNAVTLGGVATEQVEMSSITFPDTPESRKKHAVAEKKRSRTGKKNRELRQTSLLCVLVVTSFVAFWTPLAVYRLCFAVGTALKVTWLRRLALCLTITNSLLNPGIYFIFRQRFRVYFVKLFICDNNTTSNNGNSRIEEPSAVD
eukprot:Seg1926.2 transcript_id=Seg1926.2/GoldUCD/mRNA.D3Y31 product="5-hydroxytryptamine receptor 1F" protein_id=Seg1926.2/GoldUCD/D3Y31